MEQSIHGAIASKSIAADSNTPDPTKLHDRRSGNTLIEVILAVAITALLVSVVLSIGTEVLAFSSNAGTDFDVQYEADRAFDRIGEVLRKSGWSELDDTTYPLVMGADDTEIRFRLLTDLDGNGYAFDEETGDLEWDDTIYRIALDEDTETLAVYDGQTVVWVLGRYIESVQFSSFRENNTLHLQELRVTVTATKTAREGHELSFTSTGSIHLRN